MPGFHLTDTQALIWMRAKDARRVGAKIDQFATDPAGLANNVKALVASDCIRLRVGDYRVIMTADLVVVVEVTAIGTRGRNYE